MDEAFERLGPFRRVLKRALTDPTVNYFPAGLMRGLLRFSRSELAAANWAEPGGWRSMVISYKGEARQVADRLLLRSSTVSMALRNRFRLTCGLLRGFIESLPPPVHVLCLGAGPGQIVLQAMASASVPSDATLVDLNPEAFEFGRALAAKHGLQDRVRFIEGDVRDVRQMLAYPPAVVKMIGICEYLTCQQVFDIAAAVAEVMPAGAPIVLNNVTRRHGNDRFLRHVFGLHLIYRSVEELVALLEPAGFGGFEVHDEPLGVYSVVVGYRQGRAGERTGVHA